MAEKVEKGDHVKIGFGKVHWVVEDDPAPLNLGDGVKTPLWVFHLRSGMTQRRRTEICRLGEVIVFQKGKP